MPRPTSRRTDGSGSASDAGVGTGRWLGLLADAGEAGGDDDRLHLVGLDLTRRDLQAQAKAKGHPWDAAKAFDHSAPVSALRPAAAGVPAPDARLTLHVDGQLRQQGRLDEMVLGVPEILAALSRLFELRPGDLVFTGTPAGVAALRPGDRFHAELEGVATLDGRIA